ncbi:hypothetical protein [Arsenophonus sp. PmNCSU2021_1]|uniref:hypothetical protein n=1 Tax=Arsenophonus sp. PmNCSU2021_1 TaxID=3118989 RepID=UPI002FF163EF
MSNSSYKCHEIQKEIAVAKENFTCLGLNYPSWLDDYSRFKPDAAPLSHDEHMEGLKCLTAMVRRNIALKYIISCHDRFGFKDIFVYENTVTEVNKELIENVLVCQIEKSTLNENPDEKYIAVLNFYFADSSAKEKKLSPWMQHLIDAYFIENIKLSEIEPLSTSIN